MGVRSMFLTTVFLLASLSLAQKSSAPLFRDVLSETKNLDSFREFLTTQFPELEAILSTQEQFSSSATLLAPSDDAFDRLVSSSFGSAFAENDTASIRSLFNYHTLPGDHSQSTANGSFTFFPTLLDNTTYTNVTGGQRLGFVKQGEDELIVVSGSGTRSKVAQADISFKGGVMHVLESALLPPEPLIEAALPFNLTGFLGAVNQNDSLAQSISEASDLTIFAPNNAAFKKVGSAVTSMDQESLSSLLEYHIVTGKGGPFYTSSLSNGTIFQTLLGQNLTVQQASNSIFVNSARMLQTDILIANGVIHVIDNVLNPNATGAVPDPAVGTQAPAVPGSSLADTPFTDIIPSLTESAAASVTGQEGNGSTNRSTASRTSSTAESSQTGVAPRAGPVGVQSMIALCGVTAFCASLQSF